MESYLCMNSKVMEFRMFLSLPGSVCGAARLTAAGSKEYSKILHLWGRPDCHADLDWLVIGDFWAPVRMASSDRSDLGKTPGSIKKHTEKLHISKCYFLHLSLLFLLEYISHLCDMIAYLWRGFVPRTISIWESIEYFKKVGIYLLCSFRSNYPETQW